MTSSKHRGFTLLEMLITVTIIIILASFASITVWPLLSKDHVDSAYATTLMALRNTRYLAITQSHEYYVFFNPGGYPAGTIEVEYQPPAVAGVYPALQLVNTYTIPSDTSYAVMAGFPGSAPDGFGAGATAIDFGQGLGAGSLNYLVFMPDGSSQDNLGNYNSGVLYMIRANDTIYSGRSISVWGATGRIRGWRLNNVAGTATWVQQ